MYSTAELLDPSTTAPYRQIDAGTQDGSGGGDGVDGDGGDGTSTGTGTGTGTGGREAMYPLGEEPEAPPGSPGKTGSSSPLRGFNVALPGGSPQGKYEHDEMEI